MGKPKHIQGEIVRILSPSEFIINKGKEEGILTGTRFNIVDDVNVQIRSEILRKIRRHIKGEIYAVEVGDRYTVCRTPMKINVMADTREGAKLSFIPGLKRYRMRAVETRVELPIDDSNMGKVTQSKSDTLLIRIGDKVLQSE